MAQKKNQIYSQGQSSGSGQSFQSLDPNQQFDTIFIESQDFSQKLTKISYKDTLDIIQKKINEMATSNYYKRITTHFGAKSESQFDYIQQKYSKQIQILKLQLEQEKQFFKNIIRSSSEQDLKKSQQLHEHNASLIEAKRTEIEVEDFVPCIFIDGQKKHPLYGSVQQQFNRRGMGVLTAKFGLRSPFKAYDKVEFDLQLPEGKQIFRYNYQVGLQWSNPFKVDSNYYLRLNSSKNQIFRGIDTQVHSFQAGIQKQQSRYEIQMASRRPYIFEQIYKQCKQEFYKPSRNLSLKFNHNIINNITFGDVIEGKYQKIKAEVTIPGVSDSNYIKLEYGFKRFYDTYDLRSKTNSQLLRKVFWKSTFQLNFNINTILQYGKSCYLNDVLDNIDVRGFQQSRRPTPSFLNMKSSAKLNIHNYPVIGDARIISFLYTQAGISFMKNHPISKPYASCSSGLGLAFHLTPLIQIQAICGLAQLQNKNIRQPLNFQIRIGSQD